MTDPALLAHIDMLTAAVLQSLRMQGSRLSRADMCKRLDVTPKTLSKRIITGHVPQPGSDGKWLRRDVMSWERPDSVRWMSGAAQSMLQQPAYRPAESQAATPFQLYRHFDKAGKLLYVGVSLSAVSRLCEHRKDSHWACQIARVQISHWDTRADSLIAERQAIQRERPRYNKHHAEQGHGAH